MKIVLQVVYDPGVDPHVEALRRDKFLRKIYPVGKWGRGLNGGLEITL